MTLQVTVQGGVPPAVIADGGRPFIKTKYAHHDQHHAKAIEIHGDRCDWRGLEALQARIVNHR